MSLFSAESFAAALAGLRGPDLSNVDVKTVAALAVGSTAAVVVTAVVGFVALLRRISSSVGVAGPTDKQLREEMPGTNCVLFRHLPYLCDKIAWRSLGAARTTPIHVCALPKVQFYVKREDLISNRYGGNKVRTLQHQLAVCEARRDRGDTACRQLVPLGSGGSNQVIATVVHACPLGWNGTKGCTVNACWFDKDEPDLDNTLNMLSVLSFSNVGYTFNWGTKPGFFQFLRAIKGAVTQSDFLPLMLGGNCTAGVFGQLGGILELAEQIQNGDCPDMDRIYVAVGSGCTVSGLIMGTVLVRHLKLQALSGPDFKIVGCNVHDAFAAGDRLLGLHVNPWLGFMPLTITHTVMTACRTLKQLGGPDLQADCRAFIKNSVELRADADVVGSYGAHSEKSREAAQYYDQVAVVTDYKTGQKEKELWVCGHFVAKAYQPLVKDLQDAIERSPSSAPPKYMLWQTKSAIQPKGPLDEWETMKQQNDVVKEWAKEGKAESPKYRPGKVSIEDGKPEDYRSIMTTILVG